MSHAARVMQPFRAPQAQPPPVQTKSPASAAQPSPQRVMIDLIGWLKSGFKALSQRTVLHEPDSGARSLKVSTILMLHGLCLVATASRKALRRVS